MTEIQAKQKIVDLLTQIMTSSYPWCKNIDPIVSKFASDVNNSAHEIDTILNRLENGAYKKD
jgi:hypothetical protein